MAQKFSCSQMGYVRGSLAYQMATTIWTATITAVVVPYDGFTGEMAALMAARPSSVQH
jgi:hypothetical protein